MRDMTQKQFEEAMARHGFTKEQYDFLGGDYWRHETGVSVPLANAGKNRRTKLAYAIKAKAGVK